MAKGRWGQEKPPSKWRRFIINKKFCLNVLGDRETEGEAQVRSRIYTGTKKDVDRLELKQCMGWNSHRCNYRAEWSHRGQWTWRQSTEMTTVRKKGKGPMTTEAARGLCTASQHIKSHLFCKWNYIWWGVIYEMQVQAGQMQTKCARYTRTSWWKAKVNPPDQSVRRTPSGQATLAQCAAI